MIRALINIIGLEPGQTLLDPFSGSGTAIVEGQLLGINSMGLDVSPLCVIQGRVKTEAQFVIDDIARMADQVIDAANGTMFANGLKFIDVINKLAKDRRIQEFFILARMIALSDESRRNRNFNTSLTKALNLMQLSVRDYSEITQELRLNLGTVTIDLGDARCTGFAAESIDGIITSPPYSIALDYVDNDAHALADLGYDLSKARDAFIGVRGTGKDKVLLYNQDMKEVYAEMNSILKPGGAAVIIIGNATYQGRQIDSVGFTIKSMLKLGFKLEHNINKIIFGLYNIMKQENILIFRKPL